jgi:hypothetical protein
MVDLIYGRGVTDLIREVPFFASIFKKYIGITLFHSKPAMYGSVDVNNICNLHVLSSLRNIEDRQYQNVSDVAKAAGLVY